MATAVDYFRAMNKRLDDAIAAAMTQLDEAGEAELGDLVADFLARREAASFTPEELAHLRRVDAEPFDPASPEEGAQAFRSARA